MRSIKTRILTFKEYNDIKYELSSMKVNDISPYFMHCLLFDDFNNLYPITLYDDDKDLYIERSYDGRCGLSVKDISLYYSYPVIDLDEYPNLQTNDILSNSDETIDLGNYLIPAISYDKNDKNIYLKNSHSSVSIHKYRSIELAVSKYNIVLKDALDELEIKMADIYSKVTGKPKNNKFISWRYENLFWLYVADRNILVSLYPMADGFILPIRDHESFFQIEIDNTYIVKKTKDEDSVEKLYNKVRDLTDKHNIYTHTSDIMTNNLISGNYFDRNEFHDFGNVTTKQIVISSSDDFGYTVNVNQYNLKAFIKPLWLEELRKIASDNYPAYINLVINIEDDISDEKRKEIINLLGSSKVYDMWDLPSNCMITLKSSDIKLIEELSYHDSSIFEYSDNLFRSTSFKNNDSIYLSVNYSKSIYKEFSEDIRDCFIDMDEDYIVLTAGKHKMRLYYGNSNHKIPDEYYEELYLGPKRRKIENIIRERSKK